MTIRTVVFDFGNVVGFFSHQPRRRAARRARARRASTPLRDRVDFLFYTDLEPRYETRRAVAAASCCACCAQRVRPRTAATRSWRGPSPTCSRPTTTSAGSSRCCRAATAWPCSSNTNDLHYRHFRRQFADTLDRFDQLVASHEVGCASPTRASSATSRSRARGRAGESACSSTTCRPTSRRPGRAAGTASSTDAATTCRASWRGRGVELVPERGRANMNPIEQADPEVWQAIAGRAPPPAGRAWR